STTMTPHASPAGHRRAAPASRARYNDAARVSGRPPTGGAGLAGSARMTPHASAAGHPRAAPGLAGSARMNNDACPGEDLPRGVPEGVRARPHPEERDA